MHVIVKKIIRPLWYRRHVIVQSVKNVTGWTFQQLNHVPLPDDIKQGVRDVSMLSIQHMVVHSHAYQQWQVNRSGTSFVQQLVRNSDENTPVEVTVDAPTHAMWDALAPVIYSDEAGLVDVIIPVYRDYDQTLNAIYRALETRSNTRQSDVKYHVVVINDAGPDKKLSTKLQELADKGHFELLVNDTNLGFVRTVNKGMSLHPERDVILLNSDTEVYGNWVERLVYYAQQDDSVATVTPLSNNAEICSYPFFVQDNPMPLEIDYAQLDMLTADINKHETVPVPTGVGFCMFISRKAINDVGMFDADAFGRGYGEENDFCMRVSNYGYSNIMACDIFVRHIGGTSFGKDKKKLVARGYDKLCSMHPDYPKQVQQFIRDDKVLPFRRKLDIARLQQRMGRACIAMVNHQMGGGTAKHVNELSARLACEDIGAVTIEPSPVGQGSICIRHHEINHLPNLTFSMEFDRSAFVACLRELNVVRFHVHHLVNFPQRMQLFLIQIMDELQVEYDVTLHDYYMVCPRINLVDNTDRYCGEPDVSTCERCVQTTPSHAGGAAIWQWRSQHEQLLQQARSVFVPSDDVAARISAYFALSNIVIRRHEDTYDNGHDYSVPHNAGDTLRIAIVGAISQIKGSDVLNALVNDAQLRQLNIEFVLIGHTDHPQINAGKRKLDVSGQYDESDMPSLLQRYKPHLILIPSIWPETYCYALSLAWRYHIMPVVFDIGAPADRIRLAGDDAGYILPYDYCNQTTVMNDWFVAFDGETAPASTPDNVSYHSIIKDYYALDIPANGDAQNVA